MCNDHNYLVHHLFAVHDNVGHTNAYPRCKSLITTNLGKANNHVDQIF